MAGQSVTNTRKVGEWSVPPIGLGTMLMTLPHAPPGVHEDPIPEAQAIRTIHAALDAGVRVLDTAVNYVMGPELMGQNEALTAKALASWSGDRNDVLVVAKGGCRRTVEEAAVRDNSRENLRWSCETSLKALGVDRLAIYVLHAPDPAVPFEEAVGTLMALQAEGKIGMIGLSNVGRGQVAQARAMTRIDAIEHELSPGRLAAAPLAKMCEAEDIAFFAYRPVGGQQGAPGFGQTHPSLGRIAEARGVSPQRVALAWCLAQGSNIIPIPSARRPETILDSVQAADLALTAEELAMIDADSAAAFAGAAKVGAFGATR
jgi:aryl-alcohol dehydrogenase-like predicted oxidoreductase